MKIYNLGSLNIDYVYAVDHFVRAGETLSSREMNIFPGGKGLNQSVALAKAGAQVLHGAMIGSGGEFLLNTMKAAGADVSRIEKVDGSCGHAIIQVNDSGENCILLFAGTNHQITRGYIEKFLFDAEAGDVLVLQNEINDLPTVFEIAAQKGLQIALNPSPFDENIEKLPLSQVKWFFCNEIEGEALFGGKKPEEIGENFLKMNPRGTLILTLGSKGSMLFAAGKCIEQPIYKVKAVDTTAAGDTFTGYFLAALANGEDEEFALDLAARAASVTVSRAGASASIPTIEELANS